VFHPQTTEAAEHGIKEEERRRSNRPYTTDLLFALCRTYSIVLSRWGGGGKEDMVKTATAAVEKRAVGSEQATSEADQGSLDVVGYYPVAAGCSVRS